MLGEQAAVETKVRENVVVVLAIARVKSNWQENSRDQKRLSPWRHKDKIYFITSLR